MLQRLKSLPLTIILTILIWMYAESQVRLESDEFETVPFIVAYRPSPYGERLKDLNTVSVNAHIATQDISKLGGINNIHVVALPQVDISTLPPDSDQNVRVKFDLAQHPGSSPYSVTFDPPDGTALIHTPPAPPAPPVSPPAATPNPKH